jgi:hypothetical protein
MSTGAAEPTAAASALEPTSAAERAPINSVTSPRASVTVSRVRVGSRAPNSSPMLEPTITVATLISVPRPGNAVATYAIIGGETCLGPLPMNGAGLRSRPARLFRAAEAGIL